MPSEFIGPDGYFISQCNGDCVLSVGPACHNQILVLLCPFQTEPQQLLYLGCQYPVSVLDLQYYGRIHDILGCCPPVDVSSGLLSAHLFKSAYLGHQRMRRCKETLSHLIHIHIFPFCALPDMLSCLLWHNSQLRFRLCQRHPCIQPVLHKLFI